MVDQRPFRLIASEFFWKHLFKALAIIAVGIVTVFGKIVEDQISQNNAELLRLQCHIAAFAADDRLKQVEDGVFNISLDDLKQFDQFPVSELERIQNAFGNLLESCNGDGTKVLARLSAYDIGIRAYITKDFSLSVVQFQTIQPPNSTSERLLGSALFRKATQTMDVNVRRALLEEASAHFEQASSLATSELESSAKQASIARSKCDAYLMTNTDNANQRSLACLRDLIDKHFDDHNTYYNLAAVAVRLKQFDSAIEYLGDCIAHQGASFIRQKDFEEDDDFQALAKDAVFGPRFRAKLDSFPQ